MEDELCTWTETHRISHFSFPRNHKKIAGLPIETQTTDSHIFVTAFYLSGSYCIFPLGIPFLWHRDVKERLDCPATKKQTHIRRWCLPHSAGFGSAICHGLRSRSSADYHELCSPPQLCSPKPSLVTSVFDDKADSVRGWCFDVFSVARVLFDTSLCLVIGSLETVVTFIVGLLMRSRRHRRAHTLVSDSGEISQEQRYIPFHRLVAI